DSAEPQLLVTLVQLVLPAILGCIDRKEADQVLGMRRDVAGHVAVVDPQATQARFAAEDDGAGVVGRLAPIILISHRQVDLPARLGPTRLRKKRLAEVLGIAPSMTVYVERHGRGSSSPASPA